MAQIYRGTTPSVTLSVAGVDLSSQATWPVVVVTLKNGSTETDVQRDALGIERTDAGCSVTLALTQAQTLAMDWLRPTRVQLRARDAAGHAIASDVVSVDVRDVIYGGEI